MRRKSDLVLKWEGVKHWLQLNKSNFLFKGGDNNVIHMIL